MADVRAFEHVAQSSAQVGGVAVGAEVAVLEVVYHFGQAAYAEAGAGEAAGHGFDDGVGEVVAQGGHGQHVAGLVEAAYGLVVADGPYGDELSRAGLAALGGAGFGCSLTDDDDVGVHVGGGFHEVLYAFAGVAGLVGYEEYEGAGVGQVELLPGLELVGCGVEVGVDGVGYAGDAVAVEQGRLSGEVGEPLATAHEVDGHEAVGRRVEGGFAGVGGGGEAGREGTRAAGGAVVPCGTLVGVVAHGGEGPHVVHRPHHGFARAAYGGNVVEGEHSLVYPVEMDDVGFLKSGQAGDVAALRGGVDGPEVAAAQLLVEPHFQPLGEEMPPVGQMVGQVVAREQGGVQPVALLGLNDAAGGDGCSACGGAGIDVENFHRRGMASSVSFCMKGRRGRC